MLKEFEDLIERITTTELGLYKRSDINKNERIEVPHIFELTKKRNALEILTSLEISIKDYYNPTIQITYYINRHLESILIEDGTRIDNFRIKWTGILVKQLKIKFDDEINLTNHEEFISELKELSKGLIIVDREDIQYYINENNK